MAMLLIAGPIFEADLMGMQYGFRQGKSARAAIRNIQYAISMDGVREVVDADLTDYFNTIPHGALCVR
jgi:RNA-directed DNA polymerase